MSDDKTIDDFELDPQGYIEGYPHLKPCWSNEKKFIVICASCGSIKDYYISSARVQNILSGNQPLCKSCSQKQLWQERKTQENKNA